MLPVEKVRISFNQIEGVDTLHHNTEKGMKIEKITFKPLSKPQAPRATAGAAHIAA
jgi:hypothetical protein